MDAPADAVGAAGSAVHLPGLTRAEARGVLIRRAKDAKRAQTRAAGRKAGAVWWQQEDCPDWCVRQHLVTDKPDARLHDGSRLEWWLADGLTLRDPVGGGVRGDHQPVGDPPYLMVCLRQWTGASRPNVALQVGSGDWWSVREVTAEVARDLAEQLLRLADIAEGVDR